MFRRSNTTRLPDTNGPKVLKDTQGAHRNMNEMEEKNYKMLSALLSLLLLLLYHRKRVHKSAGASNNDTTRANKGTGGNLHKNWALFLPNNRSKREYCKAGNRA